MKSIIKVFQIAFVFIGTIVGAGLASGKEITNFFTVYGYKSFFTIIITGLFYIFLCNIISRISIKHSLNSYSEVINTVSPNILGKLIGGVLYSAPRKIIVDGKTIFNPADDLLREQGYKDVETAEAPAVPTRTQQAISSWQEQEDKIVQSWELKPAQPDPTAALQEIQTQAVLAQIAESALDYVKANYSAELAALDSYTVSSKIELSEADEKELDQAVKNAFAPYLTEWKAGKYYKIQVAASVLKDGQPVEGLENIIIPSLSEDVQVMLKVPGNLQQDSRNYKMLHYQNGTAEMLDCEENEGIITFKTDSFSPFALVYRDAVENSGSTDGTGVNNMGAADNTVNPKTGDHEGMACVASLFVGSLSILALTVARKRSRL